VGAGGGGIVGNRAERLAETIVDAESAVVAIAFAEHKRIRGLESVGGSGDESPVGDRDAAVGIASGAHSPGATISLEDGRGAEVQVASNKSGAVAPNKQASRRRCRLVDIAGDREKPRRGRKRLVGALIEEDSASPGVVAGDVIECGSGECDVGRGIVAQREGFSCAMGKSAGDLQCVGVGGCRILVVLNENRDAVAEGGGGVGTDGAINDGDTAEEGVVSGKRKEGVIAARIGLDDGTRAADRTGKGEVFVSPTASDSVIAVQNHGPTESEVAVLVRKGRVIEVDRVGDRQGVRSASCGDAKRGAGIRGYCSRGGAEGSVGGSGDWNLATEFAGVDRNPAGEGVVACSRGEPDNSSTDLGDAKGT